MKGRAAGRRRALLFAAALLLLVLAGALAPVRAWATAFLGWVEGLGPAGPVLYAVVFVLAVVLMLPTWELAMGAGILFGTPLGLGVTFAGNALGATGAFLLGRTVMGGVARRWIDRHEHLRAVDEEIERRGWLAAVLLRLSPLVPYNVLNYALGVTRLSFAGHLVSLPAMLPVLAFWVVLGSTVGSLTVDKDRTPTALEWAVLGVGLLSTVVLVAWMVRVARRR